MYPPSFVHILWRSRCGGPEPSSFHLYSGCFYWWLQSQQQIDNVFFSLSTVNPIQAFQSFLLWEKNVHLPGEWRALTCPLEDCDSNVILLSFSTLCSKRPCSQITGPFSVSHRFLTELSFVLSLGSVEIFYSRIFWKMQDRCLSYASPCFGPEYYFIWPLFFNLSSLVNPSGRVLKAIRHLRVRAAPQPLNHFKSCNLLGGENDERNNRW